MKAYGCDCCGQYFPHSPMIREMSAILENGLRVRVVLELCLGCHRKTILTKEELEAIG